MSDDRPRYLEAYPRLDLFRGKLSRWNEGEVPLPIVRFRVRTRHAGGAIICARMQHVLLFDYDFPSLPYCRGQDRAEIRLIERPNGVDPARQYMECPVCESGHSTLAYDRRWACRKCLKLTYRSQCIGTKVRIAEEHDRLERALGNHRAKHMRQSRYNRDLERKAVLRQQIGTYWPTVSDAYADVVEAEWLTVDQVEFPPHPNYEIVNGRVVPCTPAWEWDVTTESHEKPIRMIPPPEIL